MNDFQKDYLSYRRSEYPKQNKGYTLHYMPSKKLCYVKQCINDFLR